MHVLFDFTGCGEWGRGYMAYMAPAYNTEQKKAKPKLSSFEQQKVVDYLKLVKWTVYRIVERLPKHVDSEDLMHSGILGLIDAVQRFQWGREREKEEFKAYAECRIRGQVMDELRHQDILPRSTREKVNHYKKAIEALTKKLNREPNEREICEHLQIDIETCHKLRANANSAYQVSLDTAYGDGDTMEVLLKKTLNLINPHTPEGIVHVKEVRSLLAEEINRLSERERQVVSLYYLEEMTLKEIGKILSITESRVCQIHAQSIQKLMQRLKQSYGLNQKDLEHI